VNYNFFSGIAQTFRARKELELAFVLDFFVTFLSRKKVRENKNIALVFCLLPRVPAQLCTAQLPYQEKSR
jgi:hypothetical protein